MKPDVVADVGNTRIKWGLCRDDRVEEIAALPADDENAWDRRAERWGLPNACAWALAGVHPQRQLKLAEWILRRGGTVRVLSSHQELPIKVAVKEPGRVGLDRLLNAVAARDRVQRSISCLIVDAGSAVTVDWVDEIGAFQGGAIFPGCRLMAKALHDYTAALPLVELDWCNAPNDWFNPWLPGDNTERAIKAGVFWAVAGGIKATLRQLAAHCRYSMNRDCKPDVADDPVVFLTGGDARLLEGVMDPHVIVWPEMTLEGIRIAAETLS
jgi:type III pantothenate kinase